MDRLRKKRAVLRSAVTRTVNEIEALLISPLTDTGELEQRFSLLQNKEVSLAEVDKEIEAGVEEEDLVAEFEAAEHYRDSICVTRAKVTRKLEALRTSDTNTTAATNTTALQAAPERRVTTNVKLPKLEIVKFEGNVQNWRPFWDQFEGAIHTNEQLSAVEKFRYLKSYLIGKSEAAISGLSVTEGNYQAAVDLLKERFGKTDVIVNDHMSHLLNLRSVASHNVAQLRTLYDNIAVHVRSLESLGISHQSYGVLLLTSIKQKLPKSYPQLICLRTSGQCRSDICL